MKLYAEGNRWKLYHADILDWLEQMAWLVQYESLFDACFDDPPYNLASIKNRFGKEGSTEARGDVYNRSSKGFMGLDWDTEIALSPRLWSLTSQVLKPAAFSLSFGGTQTFPYMVMAADLGGFEYIDYIEMAHGSGFPKSQNVPKDLENAGNKEDNSISKIFEGYRGSLCLKPAHEPVGIFKMPNDRISSDRLYELTGWDHWFHRRELDNTPKERLKWRKKGIAIPPAIDAEVYKVSAKALRSQAKSYTKVVLRIKDGRGHKEIELGRCQVRDYREWYTESIAANALVHNTGVMDIDGSRIEGSWSWGTQTDIKGGNYNKNRPSDGHVFDKNVDSDPGGRWPANIVFQHHPECMPVDEIKVKGSDGYRPNPVAKQADGYIQFSKKPVGYQKHNFTDEDGKESIIEYKCHPDCLVHQLDLQGGFSKSIDGRKWKPEGGNNFTKGYSDDYKTKNIGGLKDSGYVSRYFFTPDWSLDIAERLLEVPPFKYISKPTRQEKDAGLTGKNKKQKRLNSGGLSNEPRWAEKEVKNPHPTTKSLLFCKYIAGLILPPKRDYKRRILVRFGGVGSEAIGCLLAGWDEVVAIEIEESNCEIFVPRVSWWEKQIEFGLTEVDEAIKYWRKRPKKVKRNKEEFTQLGLF